MVPPVLGGRRSFDLDSVTRLCRHRKRWRRKQFRIPSTPAGQSHPRGSPPIIERLCFSCTPSICPLSVPDHFSSLRMKLLHWSLIRGESLDLGFFSDEN